MILKAVKSGVVGVVGKAGNAARGWLAELMGTGAATSNVEEEAGRG